MLYIEGSRGKIAVTAGVVWAAFLTSIVAALMVSLCWVEGMTMVLSRFPLARGNGAANVQVGRLQAPKGWAHWHRWFFPVGRSQTVFHRGSLESMGSPPATCMAVSPKHA